MKKNLLVLSLVLTNLSFAEEFEKVKRHSAYYSQDVEFTLGKVESIDGIKLRKVVKEKPPGFSEQDGVGYEIDIKDQYLNLSVDSVGAKETLECELEKIDIKSKKIIKISDWQKRGFGEACRDQTPAGDNEVFIPTKVKKVYTAKRLESKNFNKAQTSCAKKQIDAIEKSELFKLYYGTDKKRTIGLHVNDYSNVGNKPLESFYNKDDSEKYYTSVGESNFSGYLAVTIDREGKCKFTSANDIDKQIVSAYTQKAVKFIDMDDIAKHKSVLLKSKDEEPRKDKEVVDTKGSDEEKDKKEEDSEKK